MHDQLGLGHLNLEEIRAGVIDRVVALYREHVPLPPGARSAVEAAGHGPVAVASGSDRVLLDTVLGSSALGRFFTGTIAGDEVAEDKPGPVIYQKACALLGTAPRHCVAVEGLRCGHRVGAGRRDDGRRDTPSRLRTATYPGQGKCRPAGPSRTRRPDLRAGTRVTLS
jgi:hypothetical protein